jgi:hypothetical protein
MLTFGVNWSQLLSVVPGCFTIKLMRSSEVHSALTDVQTPASLRNISTVPRLNAQYRCNILQDHLSPRVQHPKLMIEFSKRFAQFWTQN